jgi:hypothetical protein
MTEQNRFHTTQMPPSKKAAINLNKYIENPSNAINKSTKDNN